MLKLKAKYKIEVPKMRLHNVNFLIEGSKMTEFPSLSRTLPAKFNIFLTVHLRIILVGNQLDTQFVYTIFI